MIVELFDHCGPDMAISIKTPEEIEKMRVAGRLAADVLEMIEPHVKPGVTTGELDRICHDYIVNHQQAISACRSSFTRDAVISAILKSSEMSLACRLKTDKFKSEKGAI